MCECVCMCFHNLVLYLLNVSHMDAFFLYYNNFLDRKKEKFNLSWYIRPNPEGQKVKKNLSAEKVTKRPNVSKPVILPRNEMRGEITECYFYRLSIDFKDEQSIKAIFQGALALYNSNLSLSPLYFNLFPLLHLPPSLYRSL